MGRRLSGNGGGGAPRARTINLSAPATAGAVATVGRFGLLAPASFAKSGGSANLTIAAATGVISAGTALGAGVTQTLNGTLAAADGVTMPFVVNLTGQSGQSSAATVPAAPAVTLTAASGQVSVAWTDGSNGGATITAHKLYRGTTSGFVADASTLVATVTSASPYVDAGRANGTTLYYRAVATNAVGDGPASAQASAMPTGVPDAPTISSVAAGTGQVSLAFADAGSNGGSALTGHKLHRATTSGFTPGAANLVATFATASPYVDGGLTGGTTYYYKLKSTNAVGDGAASNEVSATPTAAAASGSYLAGVASQPYAVYGARRLVGGYAGNLFTLRRTSDSATLSFACAAGSDKPDYAAIASWAGSSDLFVTAVFDQTGQRDPLTQATVAKQLRFDLSQQATYATPGVPLLMGEYGSSPSMSAAGFTLDRQNVSYVAIGHALSSAHSQPLVNIEDGTGAVVQAFQNSSNAGRLAEYTSAGAVNASTQAWIRTQRGVVGMTSSATERRFFYRETNETVAAATSAAATTIRIGTNATFNQSPSWSLWGIALYPALSQADMASVVASATTLASVATSFDRRLVIGGDSISAGQQYAKYLRNLPYAYLPGLNGSVEMVNRGVGGSTLATLDTGYASTTSGDALARVYTSTYGASRCMLIVQRGTNDLVAGSTATTVYSSLSSVVAKAKTSGYKVGVCTIIPRAGTGWTAAVESERLSYNTMVRNNAAAADFVIDLAANATMGDGTNANSNNAYFADGIHPTDLGYQTLAPMYQQAINAAWV